MVDVEIKDFTEDEGVEAAPEIFVEQPEPEEAELDTGFELELVDPAEYGKEETRDLTELEKELAELKAQKTTPAVDPNLMATVEAVKALQEQLASGINVNTPKKEAAPAINLDALKSEVDQQIWSKPSEQILKLLSPVVNELNQKIEGTSEAASKLAGKNELLLDDDSRAFYVKYKDEVESVASGLKGTDAYTKAIATVKSAHIDDIIAEKVAAALETEKKPANTHFTTVGKPAAPIAKPRPRVTPGMKAWIEDQQFKGVSDMDYLLDRAKELKALGAISN